MPWKPTNWNPSPGDKVTIHGLRRSERRAWWQFGKPKWIDAGEADPVESQVTGIYTGSAMKGRLAVGGREGFITYEIDRDGKIVNVRPERQSLSDFNDEFLGTAHPD